MNKLQALKGFSGSLALTAVILCFYGCREKYHPRQGAGLTKSDPLFEDLSSHYRAKKEVVAKYADAITVQDVHGSFGGKNPAHLNSKGKGVIFTADALYWKATEDNLTYASKVTGSGPTYEQYLETPHFNWKPGLRLGLGGFFGKYDQWDLYFNWTYLYSKATNSSSATSSSDFLMTDWFDDTSFTSGSAKWKLDYNTLDIEVGRNYFISKKITMRPHVGVRGAWIHQKYNTEYGGMAFEGAPGLVGNESMHAKNNFSGVGIRGGADFLWHLDSHWSLFSDLSAALFYGYFHVDQEYEALAPTSFGSGAALGEQSFQVKDKIHRVRTNLEGSIGIQWETSFNRGRRHFTVGLGYDVSEWFAQNELFNVDVVGFATDSPSVFKVANTKQHGDLGLSGVSLDFRFDF